MQVLVRYCPVRKNHLATDRTGPRVLLEKPHHALKAFLVHARIGIEEKNAAGLDVRPGQIVSFAESKIASGFNQHNLRKILPNEFRTAIARSIIHDDDLQLQITARALN